MGFVQGAASIERLREEIQAVRYREATTTFCRLVTEESRPLKDTSRRPSPRRRPMSRSRRT